MQIYHYQTFDMKVPDALYCFKILPFIIIERLLFRCRIPYYIFKNVIVRVCVYHHCFNVCK